MRCACGLCARVAKRRISCSASRRSSRRHNEGARIFVWIARTELGLSNAMSRRLQLRWAALARVRDSSSGILFQPHFSFVLFSYVTFHLPPWLRARSSRSCCNQHKQQQPPLVASVACDCIVQFGWRGVDAQWKGKRRHLMN